MDDARDPEELTAAATAEVRSEIPPATTMGPVHLTVADRPAREQPVQVRVVLDHAEEGVQALADPGHRRLVLLDRGQQPLEQHLGAALAQRHEQVCLVGEVPVQHRLRHPGFRGHVFHGEVGAVLGDRTQRGVHELGPPGGPVLAPEIALWLPRVAM